jgi:hypothetical protein
MAPERESGEMLRNGTAVGIALALLLPLVLVPVWAAAKKGVSSAMYIKEAFL